MFNQTEAVQLSPEAAAALLKRKRVKALGQFLASVLFSLGALWLLLHATNQKEQWIGGGWLAFCCACIAITWHDWRSLCAAPKQG